MLRRVFPTALAALLCAIPERATAQTASATTTAAPTALDPFNAALSLDDARAEAEFARGVALYRGGRPLEAADAFERSDALRPSANTLFNIGQAYRSGGSPLGAIAAFERYLELPALPAERRESVERAVADMRRALATLTLRPVPASARMTVDGRVVAAGAAIVVDPGRHVVDARAAGYGASALSLMLRSEEQREITIRLDRSSVARQWWFWTGLGTLVTVAAVTASMVLLYREEPPSCGALNVCVTR